MKTSQKYGLLIIFMPLLAVFLLSGCSPKAKSEKEIIADLQESPCFFPEQEVLITDYEIIKRQTDKKNKSDMIYVKIFAENDNITCELSYSMTYALYNEGWILDNVSGYNILDWIITPLQGVDDATIQSVIDSYINDGTYDSLEITSRDTELGPNQGTDTIYFDAVKEHVYATEHIILSKTWYFSDYLYAFESPDDMFEYIRAINFNSSLTGASWRDLIRYKGASNLFLDRFDIHIKEWNSDNTLYATIARKQFNWDLTTTPIRESYVAFYNSDYAYNSSEDKWGLSLSKLNGVLYDSTDSVNFEDHDYFYFDLDDLSDCGLVRWYSI